VNKFLPNDAQLPKVKGNDVLIRHLVTHSSCLPRMPGNFNPPSAELNNPYQHYSEKELLAFLPQVTTTDCELNTSPVYSNLGAGLLGYILTKVSGKTYADLINERIAKPLKTKNFGVIGSSDRWAQGHTPSGATQPQWTFTEALVGAGGVDASVEDMVKLLLFLMKPDQSPLGKAVVASKAVQLRGPQGAFGTFWIHQPKGTNLALWHNGQTGGFNAFIAWIEGTQTGVFILSNNGEDIATGLGVALIGEEK
jgi:CubicO group peptidase (beta-lactamase class C family)